MELCFLGKNKEGLRILVGSQNWEDLGDLRHIGSDMSQDARCLCNSNAFQHLSFCRITIW